jgi:hypothetical protein
LLLTELASTSSQKANRAFFKLNCRLLFSRIARSQLGIENEAPELPVINILGRV